MSTSGNWYFDSADFILETLDEGVQFWDTSGHLNYANPASLEQIGHADILQTQVHWLNWLPHFRDHKGVYSGADNFPVSLALQGIELDSEQLFQVQHSDGSRRWLRFHAHPRFDGTKVTGAVSATVDITRLVEQEKRLQQEAHYDLLTGLPNRALLSDRIYQAFSRSHRTGELLAVCLMDLDGFKAVNDTYGHSAGDQLLQEISRRLMAIVRGEDTVSRLGGDEFALLLGGLDNIVGCEHALKRLLNVVSAPCIVAGHVVKVSASIGVALCPLDSSEPEQLLRHADQAMYRAKQSGKNCFDIFNQTLESKVKANQLLLRKIEQALENEEFSLFYQPQVDCQRGQVVGLEALIRWKHPILGIRTPGEFLPLIEHDNLISRLGEWAIDAAMKQLEALHAQGHRLSISVNIAAHQFLHGRFNERLEEILTPYSRDLLRYLDIEILESAALEDVGLVTRLIKQYQARGVSFSLDDFGTGYSSLAHLKHLPVNALKIDQSFVRDMLTDSGDLNIVQAVIGLAQSFQKQVIAEGVESIEQLLMLVTMGCNVIQGYGIARPMTAKAIFQWLDEFNPDPRWRLAGTDYPSNSDFHLLLLESEHEVGFKDLLRQFDAPVGESSFCVQDCRFGLWLKDPIVRDRFGALADFRAVERAHDEYHHLLKKTPIPYRLGAGSQGILDELKSTHEQFKFRLNQFRLGLQKPEK